MQNKRDEICKRIKKDKKRKNIFFNLAALTVVTLLSGCSSLNSKFDCPRGPGIYCKSISEINTMVNKGQVGNPNNDKKSREILDNLNNSIWEQNLPYVDYASNSQASKEQEKQKDHGLRIWMAPYEDFYGNFHEQTYLYAKVSKNEREYQSIENPDKVALFFTFQNSKNKCELQKTC